MMSLSRPTEPPNAADPSADDADHYRIVLRELIDIGADLARQINARAKSDAASAECDPTIAFDRIARSIRRCIALARILDDPASSRINTVQHRIAARKSIIRAVEDVIQRQPAAVDTESLHAELLDRLDEPDLDDDIDGRPVGDIIADICRDLGIVNLVGAHPWQRRTPADIAILYARAAKPAADTPRNGAGFMLSSARFRGK